MKPVPCFLDYFFTLYGLASLLISGILGIIGALWADRLDLRSEEDEREGR